MVMAVKIKDINKIPELLEKTTRLNGREINAGVLEDGFQTMLAHVHEYGIDIKITPRMRAYLHYRGLHLRKDKTHITIPERSYIRSGWDQNKDAIMSKVESLAGDVVEFNVDVEKFLEMIALEIEGKLKDKLVEVSSPPLQSISKKWRKSGGTNPLVDTGSLLSSITHEVK